jgi:hypothetical protein
MWIKPVLPSDIRFRAASRAFAAAFSSGVSVIVDRLGPQGARRDGIGLKRNGVRQELETPDLIAPVDLSAVGGVQVDARFLRSASQCCGGPQVQQGIAVHARQHVFFGDCDLSANLC